MTLEQELARAVDQARRNMDAGDVALLNMIDQGKEKRLKRETRKRIDKLAQLGVITLYLNNAVEVSNIGRHVLDRR